MILLMMDEASEKGFIPDAIDEDVTELIWGRPYRFTEVKGWKDMSKTGNLKSMREYVNEFGGHLHVVFRPDTSLTGSLEKALAELKTRGLAEIVHIAP